MSAIPPGSGIGRGVWAIAEGCLAGWSHGPEPTPPSHHTLCFLNAGDADAQVELQFFFASGEPAGLTG